MGVWRARRECGERGGGVESELGVWRASMGVWTARWGCGERGGGVESEAGVWGAR